MRGVGTRASVFLAVLLTTAVSAGAGEVFVPAGGNLQAALDAAGSGDTIVLEAGATYTGNFVLRARPMTAPLVIRTAPPAGVTFPARGRWPLPAEAVHYAKLASPNVMPTLHVRPGMHFVTLEHVELRATHGQYAVLELGAVGSTQTTHDQAPREIVLDHVFMNVPDTVGVRRGVALNSAKTRIVDCHLAGFKYAGEDSQAIAGWNGPGPFDIEHNYLVGAGENFMLGGSDPSIPYLVPTGVRFVRNYLTKPLAWKGSSWTVKNIFELKNAQDVHVEGNVFEHNWLAAQNGFSILLTPRNQYGGNPATVVQRVVFRNNIVRHVSAVFNILGQDYNYPSQVTNDIRIENNLFENVDWTQFGGTGRFMQVEGAVNVVVRNNTSPHQDGQIVFAYGKASTGFVLENNVFNYGNYGIHGNSTSPGNSTIATWLPGAVILGNVIPAAPYWTYPAGNHYPKTWADVQLQSDYSLAPTSPYIAGGTDGRAPGVDLAQLNAALAGTPSATPPPPVPVPPQVTITSPSSGETLTGTTVALAVNASDADGTIARVAYYANGSLVFTATAAPWAATWSGVTAGTYTLTAVATDSTDLSTTSAAVNVVVEPPAVPPTVSITAPVAGASLTGTTVSLAATAADTDGTVGNVAFYANGTLVATASSAPWTATWSNVAPGSYSLTAVATDSTALSTTSAAVGITVNAPLVPPSVAITSPATGATLTGTTVSLAAAAADADGAVARVAFYANGTLVGAATSAPWTATWTNVAPNSYTLVAIATDSSNLTTTSAAIGITVRADVVQPSNQPPTVRIQSPADGAVIVGNVSLSASASDPDGTVVRVAYYANGKLVATSTSSGSWSASWTNVKVGSYTLTAVATDNTGATTTSVPVSISVKKNTANRKGSTPGDQSGKGKK